MKRLDFDSLQLGEILGNAREVVDGRACQEENENLGVLVIENKLNKLGVSPSTQTNETELGITRQLDVIVLQ